MTLRLTGASRASDPDVLSEPRSLPALIEVAGDVELNEKFPAAGFTNCGFADMAVGSKDDKFEAV